MRAQATIEYLLLSLVAIALVSFSALALIHIRDSSARSYDAVAFKGSATELANAINEACALGDGNSRVAYVRRRMDVSGGGGGGSPYYAEFADAASNLSLVEEAFCEVEGQAGLEGKTEIRNEGGRIALKKA